MFKKGDKVITSDGRKGVYLNKDKTGFLQHWVKLDVGEYAPCGVREPFDAEDLKLLDAPKPKTKFKVGDKVKYTIDDWSGVGKVVGVDTTLRKHYLVHSKDINGHAGMLAGYPQNNRNNWWFEGVELELVTGDTPVNTSNPFNIVKIEKENNVTIVEFEDGSKTQVVKDENDVDSLYSAVAAAVAKKVYGSNSQFKSQIAKAYTHKPKYNIGNHFGQGVAIEIVEANGDFYYVLDNYGTLVMHKESELEEALPF